VLQNTLLSSAALAEFYRFALLLTGCSDAAERVLAATLEEAEKRIGDVRDETQRAAWFAARIRQCCLENRAVATPAPASIEVICEKRPLGADDLARHFRALPEPERSALALFYLDPFSLDQIAHLLGMKLDELAETLRRARSLLQGSVPLPLRQPA
jgi:DNA-directed RNA polymerase specialized sigma24 family protein